MKKELGDGRRFLNDWVGLGYQVDKPISMVLTNPNIPITISNK